MKSNFKLRYIYCRHEMPLTIVDNFTNKLCVFMRWIISFWQIRFAPRGFCLQMRPNNHEPLIFRCLFKMCAMGILWKHLYKALTPLNVAKRSTYIYFFYLPFGSKNKFTKLTLAKFKTLGAKGCEFMLLAKNWIRALPLCCYILMFEGVVSWNHMTLFKWYQESKAINIRGAMS